MDVEHEELAHTERRSVGLCHMDGVMRSQLAMNRVLGT